MNSNYWLPAKPQKATTKWASNWVTTTSLSTSGTKRNSSINRKTFMKEMTKIQVKNPPVRYHNQMTAKLMNFPVKKSTTKMTSLPYIRKRRNNNLKLTNLWILVSRTSRLPSIPNLNLTWPLTSVISDSKSSNLLPKLKIKWNSTSPNSNWPKPKKSKTSLWKKSTTTKKRKNKEETNPSNRKSTKNFKNNWTISEKKWATRSWKN